MAQRECLSNEWKGEQENGKRKEERERESCCCCCRDASSLLLIVGERQGEREEVGKRVHTKDELFSCVLASQLHQTDRQTRGCTSKRGGKIVRMMMRCR